VNSGFSTKKSEGKMAYNNPTIPDFKNYFTRDFPYGTDPNTSVLDADIGKAYSQVNFAINPALFTNQENYTLGYLWLAAHWLVIDLRAASQGISGQYEWLTTSKSVGSVSESFQIPQRILDNPLFSGYSKTNYGAKYLQLLLPALTGNMFIACGRTLP
jgi:hypothetical protein